ncbi:hypothetical protein Tco_1162716 [Tanacetum coccineum]
MVVWGSRWWCVGDGWRRGDVVMVCQRGGWWSRDGDEGGGGCDGGRRVVATGAVAARGGEDRVDRVMRRLLGLGRKTRRKSGGCGGGRNVGRKR